MPTARTKTFKSGNSEALRLPRELAFGIGTELILERSGDVLKIYPPRPKRSLRALVQALEALPKPDSVENRDEEIIPEPKGL